MKIIILTFGLLATSLAASAAVVTLTPSPESRVRLEGDSTLHPFWSEVSSFTAVLTVDAAGATAAAVSAAVSAGKPVTLSVTIPVANLKSEHAGLDKNLRKALSVDKNPAIVYTLESYEVLAGKDGLMLAARGSLSIAGKTRPEVLKASATIVDGGFVVDGEQSLLMTDFGVKPPTMMLGTVKTADKIVVKYHLVFEPVKQ
jgi:polyisoprenoid-binding protein YceI